MGIYKILEQLMYPLLMEAGQIVSGYINLTPVSRESRFVAELYIGNK